MVLDISLYMTLHRLMGRKSLALSEFFIFGMREIKVWFKCVGMEPIFKSDRVALITLEPTIL